MTSIIIVCLAAWLLVVGLTGLWMCRLIIEEERQHDYSQRITDMLAEHAAQKRREARERDWKIRRPGKRAILNHFQ